MERERSMQASPLMWALVAGLISHSLVIPVMSTASVGDEKNYYSPDPHAGSHHGGSHTPPSSHGSGGGYGSTPPPNGTPSHGGRGGSQGRKNCGNPPNGGHYDPIPTPPTGGSGGGYYHSPPSYGGNPPTSPSTPPIISTPPTIISPPTTPTPGISIPSPPFDPNTPVPGTCIFWGTHPGLIWGLFGFWGTMGGAFGVPSGPGFGANISLQQALLNTRTDGLGALYREGAASLLNSMVNKRFPYTTKQVRESFIAALGSNKAAASQARLFKLANEGRLKQRS